MEIEELKSRFTDALGSTKLQLSERTIEGMMQDALAEIGDDDSRVTDDFLQRKVNLAKTIEGQVNHDVAIRIEGYKKSQKTVMSREAMPHGTGQGTVQGTGQVTGQGAGRLAVQEDGGEPEWFKAYREEQDAKIAALENARQQERIEASKKDVLAKVTKALDDKFRDAGIEKNGYIMRQTLRDIEIPDTDADVKRLVKDAEKLYYSNLKEAGFGTDAPRRGYLGVSKGKTHVDDYFKKKAKREGWG